MRFMCIKLPEGTRMIRVGFGKFQGRWFIRIDLWNFWVRLEAKEKSDG